MPQTEYSSDETDAAIATAVAGTYTQGQVDALLTAQQAQIDALAVLVKPPPPPPPPPVASGLVLGSGDMVAFRGLTLSGHRTYNGFGSTRQQNAKLATAEVQADAAAGRRPYFSIGFGNNKAHPGGPADFPYTSAQLRALPLDIFLPAVQVTADTGGVTIIHHEPEDDPGTAPHFQAAFTLMSAYLRSKVPHVRIGCCLMSWTASPDNPHAPGFAHWAPDPASYDVFCIDGYSHAVTDSAAGLYAPALAYAKSISKPLAITETGREQSLGADAQIAWLDSLDQFAQANRGTVEAVLYWNGGGNVHSYRLLDPALQHYGQLLAGGHYLQGKIAA